jgi:Tfp pilus assembly PilM family ATPase
MPVADALTLSDSKIDQQKLAQQIKEFLHQMGISSKNVAVNLPSHRVFTTVIDMDKMSSAEIAKAIRYQAESFIPTPPDESKIDWAVVGDSPKDPKKTEVLLSSVPNEFVEKRWICLRVLGLALSHLSRIVWHLTRAIIPSDVMTPQMILDIGHKATDLVIAMNGAPHLKPRNSNRFGSYYPCRRTELTHRAQTGRTVRA